jgi:8-oxo-dGTP pyrophosphatase MutT (NUDIX family)
VRLSAKFLPPSKLRKLRTSEQVAAVCYRRRGGDIEFLLVRTRGGRWTFPKGGSEPGLTHAQAAALEAFEEAGVHGQMEETSFTGYVLRGEKKGDGEGLAVKAFLCGVSRQVQPEESKRKPTWFSPQDATRKLKEGRTPRDGAEFARVVARATVRIECSVTKTVIPPRVIQKRDALQVVAFEASEVRLPILQQAFFRNFVGVQQGESWNLRQMELAVSANFDRMLQADLPDGAELIQASSRHARRLLQAPGTTPVLAHVVEIDKPHGSQDKAKISTKRTRRIRPTID